MRCAMQPHESMDPVPLMVRFLAAAHLALAM